MNNMNLPPHNMNELANTSPDLPRLPPPGLGPNDLPRYRAGRFSFIVFVVLVLVVVIGWVLLAKGVGS